MILTLGSDTPQIHPTAFVHPLAEVSGKVKIGPYASIWGGCILRGDIDWIEIGEKTNVQDGTIIHTAMGAPSILGKGVTVGHKAMIHGAVVKDFSLIGMSATLLDFSVVEENCLIGAGALVKEKSTILKGHLAVGIPAKLARPIKPEELQTIIRRADDYVLLAGKYAAALAKHGQ